MKLFVLLASAAVVFGRPQELNLNPDMMDGTQTQTQTQTQNDVPAQTDNQMTFNENVMGTQNEDPSTLPNTNQETEADGEVDAVDMGMDVEADATETDVKGVMKEPESEIPANVDLAEPTEEGPMVDMVSMTEDDIPQAPKDSVRTLLGQFKLRFLHKANEKALKAILLRKGFLGFLRPVFKLDEEQTSAKLGPISVKEWMDMYSRLDQYWSKKLGIKIPVTREQWATVAKKDNTVSIAKDIVPALFFETDRGTFDAIWSALFYRVFDFNKDGLINDKVHKMIKSNRVHEKHFFNNGVKWVKEIMDLPTAPAQEIQQEMEEIRQKQGDKMAKEMMKMLVVENIAKPEPSKKN